MSPFSIIDAHTHVFPDAIAAKASAAIGEFYHLDMCCDGRVETLAQIAAAHQIGHSVIFSTATRPDQVRTINRFIAHTVANQPRLIGLGTLHPGLRPMALRVEADYIVAAGLRGVKLHPDFQAIHPDAPDMDPLYRACIERGLCVIFHAGDPRTSYSHPAKIAAVARRHPDLPIIAAHMGGWSQWDLGRDLLLPFPQVMVDTSSTIPFLDTAAMLRLIRAFGADRVLFGSDYPMWHPGEELARFLALPLTAAERQAILGDNARALFRLASG